jgi:hypothetical protein
MLVEFVFKAIVTVEKLSGRIEVIAGAARAARAIRRAIGNRLVKTLNSIVWLATRSIKQPLRARIRAAVAILAAAFLKWDPLSDSVGTGHDHGGGGPRSARLLGARAHPLAMAEIPGPVMTAAVGLGKVYLIGSPRRGAIARLQVALDRASERASRGEVSGSTATAASLVLAAPAGSSTPGLIEGLAAEAAHRSRQAGIERHSANIAGAISDIAMITSLADPTAISKVVAIAARVLQGGLYLHSIYLSGSMLYRIPREVSRAVDVAFAPEAASTPLSVPRPAPRPRPVHVAAIEDAERSLDHGLEALAEALEEGPASSRVVVAVETVDQASTKLSRRGQSALDGGSAKASEALAQSLVAHELAICAALAHCLESFDGPKGRGVDRALLERLDQVRRTARAVVAATSSTESLASYGASLPPHGETREAGLDDEGPVLVVQGPGAHSLGSEKPIEIEVENTGDRSAAAVRLEIGVPEGVAIEGPAVVPLGEIAPGTSRTVEVRLGPSLSSTRGTVVIRALGGDEDAVHAVWLRP